MAAYFLDTEFNGHGSDEIISLALVKEDGSTLSLVFGCENPHPWVAENVIPHLRNGVVTHGKDEDFPIEEAGKEIAVFLFGDSKPLIVCDWPADIINFCKLLMPKPGFMVSIPNITFQMSRVQSYPTTVEGAIQHNSYWDAMALRRAFGKG